MSFDGKKEKKLKQNKEKWKQGKKVGNPLVSMVTPASKLVNE